MLSRTPLKPDAVSAGSLDCVLIALHSMYDKDQV